MLAIKDSKALDKIKQQVERINQIIQQMRAPVRCWKWQERKRAFHEVQVFLAKEASEKQITMCWSPLTRVIDPHSPVSVMGWDQKRFVNIVDYGVGISRESSERAYIDKALEKLPFTVEESQIFCLFAQDSFK